MTWTRPRFGSTLTATDHKPEDGVAMDLETQYRRAVEGWLTRLDAIGQAQWNGPTPCDAWSVRDLVNHVAGEQLWTTPLMDGQTIDQVGDKLDGDLLGSDSLRAARDAGGEALGAVSGR